MSDFMNIQHSKIIGEFILFIYMIDFLGGLWKI